MIAVILASDIFLVGLKMATAPQKMKVKTLEGETLAVEVLPTNTVKELRAIKVMKIRLNANSSEWRS